jgi:hypothetical protein
MYAATAKKPSVMRHGGDVRHPASTSSCPKNSGAPGPCEGGFIARRTGRSSSEISRSARDAPFERLVTERRVPQRHRVDVTGSRELHVEADDVLPALQMLVLGGAGSDLRRDARRDIRVAHVHRAASPQRAQGSEHAPCDHVSNLHGSTSEDAAGAAQQGVGIVPSLFPSKHPGATMALSF